MKQVRTCVGCGKRQTRQQLLRVSYSTDKLVCDDQAVLPGRGAWVHAVPACISQALARRKFVRALKLSANPDSTNIENRLKTIMDNS